MKPYTLPTVILLAASAALLVGAGKSFERARQAGQHLAAEEVEAATGRRSLAAVQREAGDAKRKGIPVERFLDAWMPELSDSASIEQIFGRLDTMAVNNLLSPSGKNFTPNRNYIFNGRPLTVLAVNLSVAGDYYRTLNWLGAAENAFPLARFEQISYTATGSSLSLAVQIVFPRKFDTE